MKCTTRPCVALPLSIVLLTEGLCSALLRPIGLRKALALGPEECVLSRDRKQGVWTLYTAS